MNSSIRSVAGNYTLKSFASRRHSARSILIARALLVLLFFSTLLPAPDSIVPNRVLAAEGDLVPGFGTNGFVTTDFAGGNDSAQAIAATLTGEIIAAGSATIPGKGTDFALARYDENGNLDPSFGNGGKVTTDFFGGNDGIRGIAVQLDGSIVVSGFATNGTERQIALARYLEEGNLDGTFDGDGKVLLDLGSTSEAFKLAVQADGKIVVVGDSRPQNSLEFTIVRLNPDGSLDNSFGNNGVVRVDFGNADRAIDLAVDETNIFVAGIAVKSATDSNFGVVRLNLSNGSLNPAFDGDGKLEVDFFGKRDGAQAIELRAPVSPVNEPQLIVGGFSTPLTSDATDFAVVAVNYQGSFINTLFNQGKETIDFEGGTDQIFRVFGQPDGDIVATGWAGDGANFDLGIAKWDGFGRPDLGFGLQGKYTLDTGSGGNNVAFDGMIYGANIVTAGTGINPITLNDDFVVTLNENEKFVEFTKTADPDPAVEGELITYTFTIKNLTDTAIEIIIGDQMPTRVSFDPARNPLWNRLFAAKINSKPLTVRGLETKEITLSVRAITSGFFRNSATLCEINSNSRLTVLAEADVLHEVTKAQVTNVARDGKNIKVTMNSTGADPSSEIALSAVEPQAACPVVLFDGVEQKTKLDPDNPSTVLIVKKGYKRLAPGQTVRIKVRLCSGVETDDFVYTRPQ